LKDFIELTGNYFFPMILSCYLIYKLDHFLTATLKAQRDYLDKIFTEIRDIKHSILDGRFDLPK